MTDTARFSSTNMRCRQLAGALGCLLHRAIVAHETRRALNDLPDDLLRDVGLHRSEIDFVANAIASGTGDTTREPQECVNRSAARRSAEERRTAERKIAGRFHRIRYSAQAGRQMTGRIQDGGIS